MSLDGFLTIIGLAIAVVALLPTVSRLTLRLQAGLQVPLALVATCLVLYFQFFPVVALPCPSPLGAACAWLVIPDAGDFTPQMAAFLVVLAWGIVACVIWAKARPMVSGIPVLSSLVDELLRQERMRDLVDVLHPRFDLLRLVLERRLALQRFRDWCQPPKPWGLADEPNRLRARLVEWLVALSKTILRPLADALPSRAPADEAATRIANTIYLDRNVAPTIIVKEPAFAALMLSADIRQVFGFSNALLETQIMLTNGALHDELKRTQNFSASSGYFLESDRPLLFALLGDTARANQFLVWRPLGDRVIRLLAEPTDEYLRFLHGTADHFDAERWDDPTACAIHFFDVMVRRAALAGTPSHMWLMYMRNFVEELEKSYDADLLQSQAEFPCRSAILIYEAFSALGAWVRTVEHVPSESVHAAVPNDPHLGTESIPAASAACLGQCLEIVLQSQRIGSHFANYMFECALNHLNAAAPRENVEVVKDYYARCLARGSGVGDRAAAGAVLAQRFADLDPMLRYESARFQAAAANEHPEQHF